jgi:hypothetical protein
MTDFTSPSRAEPPNENDLGDNDDTKQQCGEAINLSNSVFRTPSNQQNYDLTNSGMLH